MAAGASLETQIQGVQALKVPVNQRAGRTPSRAEGKLGRLGVGPIGRLARLIEDETKEKEEGLLKQQLRPLKIVIKITRGPPP